MNEIDNNHFPQEHIFMLLVQIISAPFQFLFQDTDTSRPKKSLKHRKPCGTSRIMS